MSLSIIRGPHFLGRGIGLLTRPGLRQFVLLPLLANLLFFGGVVYVAVDQFEYWMNQMMPNLPEMLSFLEYLLWPLFVLLIILMVFFTFTLFANLIAAPFNGLLSEKVEVMITGTTASPEFSWSELVAVVPRTLQREMQKLGYFLPRALGLLILSFIPVINLIAAPLWLVFGAWMAAVQYIDYPADNHQVSWKDMLQWIRAHRWSSLGFGFAVYGTLLVPGLNLLVIPSAVIGATLFWVEERQKDAATGAAAGRSV